MERVATKFDDAHQSLQSMLSRLMQEVEAVKGDWQGRGGSSFEQVSQAWAQDQRKILVALSETASAIRTAGKVYTATDDQAASRMKSTHVNLPL